MRILAADTASKTCSVAVLEDLSILVEIITGSGETHSRNLMKMIDHALDVSHVKISDLDGFAITKGPGSFTGLRIGISTVKGLSLASGKPVAGVSTLDVMAFQNPCRHFQTAVWLDARKGEVYCAGYRYGKQTVRKIKPDRVVSPDLALEGISKPCLFLGDGAVIYRDQIDRSLGDLARFTNPGQNAIRASAVGRLGIDLFENERVEKGEALAPYYIRRPDAETALRPL